MDNTEKKVKGLEEVKADAEWLFNKRVKDAEEKRAYEASKQKQTEEATGGAKKAA